MTSFGEYGRGPGRQPGDVPGQGPHVLLHGGGGGALELGAVVPAQALHLQFRLRRLRFRLHRLQGRPPPASPREGGRPGGRQALCGQELAPGTSNMPR